MLRHLGVAGALVLTLVAAVPAPATAAGFKKASTGASITDYKWLNKSKRAFDFTVKSPSLGASEKVRVLLPKGWKYKTKRTWPVVYLLHGGQDTYVSWTHDTKIAKLAAKWKAIVVMPEGRNGSYTNWFNGGKGGIPKWETFHMTEVYQLMEKNFHAGKNRAIMGNSSGGQGAMTYAARYPKRFKFVASYSGILSLLTPGVPTALAYVNSTNGVPDAIWGDSVKNRANWQKHDPFSLAGKLRGMKIYFSSGRGAPMPNDAGLFAEFVVGVTNDDFAERLQALNIKYKAHVYNGGTHAWKYWWAEINKAWPLAMKAIKAGKA
ncbi:alpha/beta hydrolase [Actinocorallia longicatena]|uniref:Alpha/beta hydrolase family protein n=1 Tax=Actinocorallia longicatena TaxID=111803 RepID=A0ABP6QQ45_9ACTN